MSTKNVKVKLYRYDPTKDEEPRYEDFQVPAEEQETILGVLEYIRENIDPSLAYRDSCAYGCCAICIMKVNGKNVLACTEKVQTDELLIEPVRTDKVLRDLATTF
ncbi:MAG: 2Fe-2S iron-sulfur cluster-binding protein [Dehalobacterium sp.]